jgi:hypothetical protein
MGRVEFGSVVGELAMRYCGHVRGQLLGWAAGPGPDELLITNSFCSRPLRGRGPSGHPLYGHAARLRKRRALRRTSET